jgi:benzoyl-CoA 2,3-dioxygenase component B
VPGEHRNTLRRLIVTQGDTEPASVEQQRLLGQTCPSLYDLRNLFQVNVEEGRHLWAMVYLLQSLLRPRRARGGRGAARAPQRRPDKPRILGAFNEPCTDWLSFFMFTFFTDRDGKFQLLALAESGFDPLSRTTRFMLTEEAHHMFVGETGVLARRRAHRELMKSRSPHPDDVRKQGVIDLPTMQKYLNLWYSLSLDLFGGEISLQRGDLLRVGPQGARQGGELRGPPRARGDLRDGRPASKDGKLVARGRPLRNAMNEVLRDEYVEDCQRGVDKWNRAIEARASALQLTCRAAASTGTSASTRTSRRPRGNLISKDEFEQRRDEWLPSDADKAYVQSLMQKPVYDPKQMANWIARRSRASRASRSTSSTCVTRSRRRRSPGVSHAPVPQPPVPQPASWLDSASKKRRRTSRSAATGACSSVRARS